MLPIVLLFQIYGEMLIKRERWQAENRSNKRRRKLVIIQPEALGLFQWLVPFSFSYLNSHMWLSNHATEKTRPSVPLIYSKKFVRWMEGNWFIICFQEISQINFKRQNLFFVGIKEPPFYWLLLSGTIILRLKICQWIKKKNLHVLVFSYWKWRHIENSRLQWNWQDRKEILYL